MSAYVTRFAPSPTGPLHLGHAFSALTAWQAAEAVGGRVLLRIEDIDAARCRPQFEQGIETDLVWLGLDWPRPVRRQSEHMDDYRAALARLERLGLLYRCFRTRREVLEAMASAPHDGDDPSPAFRGGPLAPSEEGRRLADGEPFAWRLSIAGALAHLGAPGGLGFLEVGAGPSGETGRIAVDLSQEGDVVLGRKDVGVAYHLAVVVDDALQGVSEVVRGEDLFAATHVQRLLQALLGLPTPQYRHHRLVRDDAGERLAKRTGAPALTDLRAAGVTAAEVRARLGFPG